MICVPGEDTSLLGIVDFCDTDLDIVHCSLVQCAQKKKNKTIFTRGLCKDEKICRVRSSGSRALGESDMFVRYRKSYGNDLDAGGDSTSLAGPPRGHALALSTARPTLALGGNGGGCVMDILIIAREENPSSGRNNKQYLALLKETENTCLEG